MADFLITIKKRSTFVHIKDHGKFIRSSSFNIQILEDLQLEEVIAVGYTATKRLGNAVIRNKSKRIMRELAKKILINGKINSYYVLIAKISIFDTNFKNLLEELDKSVNVK